MAFNRSVGKGMHLRYRSAGRSILCKLGPQPAVTNKNKRKRKKVIQNKMALCEIYCQYNVWSTTW